MFSTEILTKARLEQALADDLDDVEIAARFHVHRDTVHRAMVRHGLRERRVVVRWTPEMRRRTEAMLADGVPLTWAAETLDVDRHVLIQRGFRRGPEEAAAWKSVWQQILKNPVLLELHREFAPKTVRQIAVEKTLSAAA